MQTVCSPYSPPTQEPGVKARPYMPSDHQATQSSGRGDVTSSISPNKSLLLYIFRRTKVIGIIILQLYFKNKVTWFLVHFSFIYSSLCPLHQVPTAGLLENTTKMYIAYTQSAETYELVCLKAGPSDIFQLISNDASSLYL